MAVIDNLIAYWSLEETSGTRVDAHGANDLSDNNTVGSATGKVGTCADFEKDNGEYLSIADNADISVGDIAFSWSLWVKLETAAPFTPTILGKDNNGASREYGFYFDIGNIYFYVFGPASEFSQAGAGTVSVGSWAHLIGWHDPTANEIGCALNAGTPVTDPHTAGVRNGTASLLLGIRGDLVADTTMDGLLDEVGFWKKVLTSDERTWLYNSGNGRSYADIVAEAAGVTSAFPKRLPLLGAA